MVEVPAISFCITCKNRFHQISQTLQKNLDDNRLFQDLVEFILVDFGSTDGLWEWIRNHFMEDIQNGYLKYYYTEELPFWHASIAKNTAHLLANYGIVVNLDCDNYTGNFGGRFLIRHFIKNPGNCVIHQYSGEPHDGSFGRIGVRKAQFIEVGGYDEEFEPMLHQDLDLINRLRMKGSPYIFVPDSRYNQAIRNTKEEGISQTNSKLGWLDMYHINMKRSLENIRNGKLVANQGNWGVRKNIYDIHENLVTELASSQGPNGVSDMATNVLLETDLSSGHK
jgi:GT2 family glycosyltransferase